MSKKIDLLNKKFNRLLVVKEVGRDKKNNVLWECLCDCGKITFGCTTDIKNGHKKSCGCYQSEQTSKAVSLDVCGQKFGRLLVVERLGSYNKRESYFKCICDCGNELNVKLGHLKSGNTKSCGCYKSEIRTKLNTTHGNAKSKNRSTEYVSYHAMISRCYNKNQRSYADYGGKGVIVCDRWLNSFENFLEDMGKKPNSNYTLERIRVNGIYEPNNCKWITRAEQSKNKRTSVWHEHNGVKMILSDWAKFLNVHPSAIRLKIRSGKKFSEIYNFYKNN
jgi:hypothetical protein